MLFNERNSPLFIDVVNAVKKGDRTQVEEFLGLNPRAWPDIKKKKREIIRELIDPLYMKKGIDVQDEDNPSRHAKANLYCRLELLLRELCKIEKDNQAQESQFERSILSFHRDWRRLAPGAAEPFAWALAKPKNNAERMIQYKIDKIEAEIEKFNNILDNQVKWDIYVEDLYFRQQQREKNLAGLKENARQFLVWRIKLAKIINQIEKSMIPYFKLARGKRGKHPHPYNVLVYHLIRKATRWKLDRKRNYVLRKDGQHRLKTDWPLVIFLLLDIHFHSTRIPELIKFIGTHAKQPAEKAMRTLKNNLLSRYKNFRPIDGWPFECLYKDKELGTAKATLATCRQNPKSTPRQIRMLEEQVQKLQKLHARFSFVLGPPYQAGFRKLIVTDEGKLRVVIL